MMDYEFQPANHLSFRLANTVVVPEVFPDAELRRQGAGKRKVVRYAGFKEELYLGRYEPDPGVLAELGLDPDKIIVVFRPAPEGALYHRAGNADSSACSPNRLQRRPRRSSHSPAPPISASGTRAGGASSSPRVPIAGRALLAFADLMIGAGGTMNREAALLGTPTYTMFAGRLAAVDAELISLELMHDLRVPGSKPVYAKKAPRDAAVASSRSDAILETVIVAVATTATAR